MLYKEIKVSFIPAKDRFYRKLLVIKDIDLERLGVILSLALGAELEHMFLFYKDNARYVDESWVMDMNDKVLSESRLLDLRDSFIFEYDTGDGYRFEGEVGEDKEIDSNDFAILLDGKGQGIWEDNISTLYAYLEDEVDPDLDHEDELNGIYFPWNYEIEKLSDFDNAYDLDFEKEHFNEFIEEGLEDYYFSKEQYLYEDNYMEDFDFEEDDQISSLFFDYVEYQINNDEYVKDVYKQLEENVGEVNAKVLLSLVLEDEIYDLVNTNEISKLPSYREKIEELLSDHDMPFH